MLRSRVTDFDFENNVVPIREKKRDHEKEETYRTVPMKPVLARAMGNWFARHPGGLFIACTQTGVPLFGPADRQDLRSRPEEVILGLPSRLALFPA
jgi:hypothetical protein